MSTPRNQRGDPLDSSSSLHRPSTPSRSSYSNDGSASILPGAPNPTYATFSPATLSSAAPSGTSAAKRRSTILVHQKSPLLLATPPQITRALAYSHPFLLPLNKLVGLLTWTTGDPWESFLLVVVFWASVLYGDIVVRVAGPVALVLLLIGGMYGRRFSPLSSSGWSEPGLGTGDGTALVTEAKGTKAGRKPSRGKNLDWGPGGHTRNQGSISEITNTRHQKTLDEIVETLREFTARCNILLEPLLELTDFLSTQRTPTSATTRPALTTLFVRILLCTPFWFLLTLPPLRLITTRRVILLFGTILLTWHARVVRVTRVILWRSATIRRLLALVTGLQFEGLAKPSQRPASAAIGSTASSAASSTRTKTKPSSPTTVKTPHESELTKALRRARGARGTGVRFTFIIYENQRRWVGLGWTTSLFAYERPAWTDEHNNAVPPRDEFELPEVEDGSKMRWQWGEGSRWRVDGVPDEAVMSGDGEGEWDYDGPGGKMGWVYYDNKWQNGRRGQDGWGRWTRRRKWYRDAELVEADDAALALQEESGLETAATNGAASADDQAKTPTPSPAPPPDQHPSAVPSLDTNSTSTRSSPEFSLTPPTPQQSQVPDEHQHSKEDEYDSSSILSTSSRSARFFSSSFKGGPPPALRRRATGESHRSSRSSRRASVAASPGEDDAAAVLGTQARMVALQDTGTEVGSWGVGEEVRMGLE
ncbi:Peroxisomal membrane protein PEX30 [Madurella mycetomatis]|uniref:Peroxisomal membrane protein PEX30 n=1 Tax=Madurella mycetomatis TaxID=100816 RepID=A0A175WEM6_9PEZI|nr:Peroxisomal membrane protein PEX30 [Madurella mycetomatis]KXX82123.1 Peroxisomal membrane protein PEX30 [Madurella mycetomatis]